MQYIIYTDGAYSTERRVGAWSFLIYTEDKFLTWLSGRSVSIKSPTFAEDIAVGLACHYLYTHCNLTDEDEIIIYSDSLSTINLFNGVMSGKRKAKHKDILVADSIQNVLDVRNKCDITFVKVHGHKNSLSPNTCVNRMANYYMKRA